MWLHVCLNTMSYLSGEAKESCWGCLEAQDSFNAKLVARSIRAGDNFVLNVPPHS